MLHSSVLIKSLEGTARTDDSCSCARLASFMSTRKQRVCQGGVIPVHMVKEFFLFILKACYQRPRSFPEMSTSLTRSLIASSSRHSRQDCTYTKPNIHSRSRSKLITVFPGPALSPPVLETDPEFSKMHDSELIFTCPLGMQHTIVVSVCGSCGEIFSGLGCSGDGI